MPTFSELGLSPNVLRGIEALGFEQPTPIQEQIIPLTLNTPNDIVGLAQTGTGKTAAFGLPLLEQIDITQKAVQGLVLAPTRELCMQIARDMESYAKGLSNLRVTAIYGGAGIEGQIRSLKRGTHLIVATPGRMNDMLRRKAVRFDGIRTVVLDEADEMLNMGFREELDTILEQVPDEKRSLLFSATMPADVERIAQRYMNHPQRVTIGKRNAGAQNVQHIYYQVHARDRYLALKRIADINPDIYALVFCRTRAETKDVAEKLGKDGYNADALHGDLSQAQRDHVMKRFRNKSLQMLVATDVAARGLDVDSISHVINYNLPEDPEVYTHRTGRTGRADKSGVAISIIHYKEKGKIRQIEKMLGQKMEKQLIPSGEEITEKQLFNLISRMENVEVNEQHIAPFMESINKKLEWLDKEDIIKRFVSLEFNRLLDDYRNAPDLNDKKEYKTEKTAKKGRRERTNGTRKNSNGQFARFFINMGKKDGIMPKNLIGMINDQTRDRDISIGDIDIKDNFAFFEVSKKHQNKVLENLPDANYKGKSVRVELAEPAKGKNGRRR